MLSKKRLKHLLTEKGSFACCVKTRFCFFYISSNGIKQNRHRTIAGLAFTIMTWAPSSEFVSSSVPSWQILTAHAQPFRGARDLAFCLEVPLDSLLVWASSGGSGETARMRRLAWTFAARIGDKNQNCWTRPTLCTERAVTIFRWFPVLIGIICITWPTTGILLVIQGKLKLLSGTGNIFRTWNGVGVRTMSRTGYGLNDDLLFYYRDKYIVWVIHTNTNIWVTFYTRPNRGYQSIFESLKRYENS